MARIPRVRLKRRGASTGQAVVEFALIAPVLLFVLLIAADFGRVFFTHIQLTNAAREGVAAALRDPTDTAAITARVQKEKNAQAQGGEGSPSITIACSNASTGAAVACSSASFLTGTGTHVTVTVSSTIGFFTPQIGSFFGNGFTLRASATGTVLGATAAASPSPSPSSSAAPTPTPSSCTVNASFTFQVLLGSGPKKGKVNFVDTSTGSPTDWRWTFGDGAIATWTNGYHFYGADGTYAITLTASKGGCSSTVLQYATITNAS